MDEESMRNVQILASQIAPENLARLAGAVEGGNVTFDEEGRLGVRTGAEIKMDCVCDTNVPGGGSCFIHVFRD
jgi:hypothetical protein